MAEHISVRKFCFNETVHLYATVLIFIRFFLRKNIGLKHFDSVKIFLLILYEHFDFGGFEMTFHFANILYIINQEIIITLKLNTNPSDSLIFIAIEHFDSPTATFFPNFKEISKVFFSLSFTQHVAHVAPCSLCTASCYPS